MPSYDRRDPEKAYEQVTTDIRGLLRKLDETLRVHAGKHREKPSDWRYVGDVSEVLKRLGETVDFLKSGEKG
jgi:hypothetical protein